MKAVWRPRPYVSVAGQGPTRASGEHRRRTRAASRKRFAGAPESVKMSPRAKGSHGASTHPPPRPMKTWEMFQDSGCLHKGTTLGYPGRVETRARPPRLVASRHPVLGDASSRGPRVTQCWVTRRHVVHTVHHRLARQGTSVLTQRPTTQRPDDSRPGPLCGSMTGSAPSRPMPLLAYAHTVPWDALPRFAEVTSGVYIGGSIYDMGGSEITLSNGDVIRITKIKLDKILAKVVANDGKECIIPRGIIMEIPIDYTGLFQIQPSQRKYATFEDIAECYKLARRGGWHLAFHASVEIRAGDVTIKAGERLVPLALEERQGEGGHRDDHDDADPPCVRWRCERKGRGGGAGATLLLPLRFKGDFYEARDNGHYTLLEVVHWRLLQDGTRMVRPLTSTQGVQHLPSGFQGVLKLTARSSIVGFVNDAMGEVIIPSNLDVEVRDVTEEYRQKTFVTPVTLVEIFKYPADRFPLSVLVLEAQRCYSSCPKVKFEVGAQFTVHRAKEVRKVLVTRERLALPPQNFLVPLFYRGLVTKRPRVFCSTFDIDAAWAKGDEDLEVRATMDYQADHEELGSLAQGDRLIVRGRELLRIKSNDRYEELETLRCLRSAPSGAPHAAAAADVVHLPLYVQGSFVEVVKEQRRLSLAQVVERGPIPVNVKVVAGDPLLPDDPLASSSITVEGRFEDPCLIVSGEIAAGCFEIPINRVHMKVQVLEKGSTWPVPPPQMILEKVPSYFLSNLRGINSASKGCPAVPMRFTRDNAVSMKRGPATSGKDGQSSPMELPTPNIAERSCSLQIPTTAGEDMGRADASGSDDDDNDYEDVYVEEPSQSEASRDSDDSYTDVGLPSETTEFIIAQETASRAQEDSREDGKNIYTNIVTIGGKKGPCK
ncbi:protein THEMIS isoform X3 [Lampetra fluviatilis]